MGRRELVALLSLSSCVLGLLCDSCMNVSFPLCIYMELESIRKCALIIFDNENIKEVFLAH